MNIKNINKKRLIALCLAGTISLTNMGLLSGCTPNSKDYSLKSITNSLENGDEDTNIDENINLILKDKELNIPFEILGIDKDKRNIEIVENEFIKKYSASKVDDCNDLLYIMYYAAIKSLVLEELNISNDKVKAFGINGEYRTGKSGRTEDFYDISIKYVDDFDKEHSYNYATGYTKMRELLLSARKAYHNQIEENDLSDYYYDVKDLFYKKIVIDNKDVEDSGKNFDGYISLEKDELKKETLNNGLKEEEEMKIKLR